MRNEFFHVESVQTPLGDMDSQKEIAATKKFPIIWKWSLAWNLKRIGKSFAFLMATTRGVIWTSWAFVFIVIERFFENPLCTRPREKLAKSPKRRKQPYSMLGKCCLILGGSTAPIPI